MTKIQKDLLKASKKKNPPWAGHAKSINEKSFMGNVMKKAKDFIKTSATNIKKNAKSILKQLKKDFIGSKSRSNFQPGKMVAMNYKAKDSKKKYDANPLVIMLGPSRNPKLSKTHVLGLNLHWMPMKSRVNIASFFAELNEKRGGITYDDIKPFIKKFQGSPVLRMYIIKNIGGKVIEMPKDQFLTAAAIPSEKWLGGSR